MLCGIINYLAHDSAMWHDSVQTKAIMQPLWDGAFIPGFIIVLTHPQCSLLFYGQGEQSWPRPKITAHRQQITAKWAQLTHSKCHCFAKRVTVSHKKANTNHLKALSQAAPESKLKTRSREGPHTTHRKCAQATARKIECLYGPASSFNLQSIWKQPLCKLS